jgi:hypothetical protein
MVRRVLGGGDGDGLGRQVGGGGGGRRKGGGRRRGGLRGPPQVDGAEESAAALRAGTDAGVAHRRGDATRTAAAMATAAVALDTGGEEEGLVGSGRIGGCGWRKGVNETEPSSCFVPIRVGSMSCGTDCQ